MGVFVSEENKVPDDVYVTETDIQHVEKFFEHFKIPVPQEFAKSIADFRANPNAVTQNELRYQLSQAMMHKIKGHSQIVDEVFEKVFECSDEIRYDLQFEKDLEDIVGQKPVTPTNQGSET